MRRKWKAENVPANAEDEHLLTAWEETPSKWIPGKTIQTDTGQFRCPRCDHSIAKFAADVLDETPAHGQTEQCDECGLFIFYLGHGHAKVWGEDTRREPA